MIIKAIQNLRPNSSFTLMGDTYDTLVWQDDKNTPPTQSEVDAEIALLQAEYQANAYKSKRAAEYPPITDFADAYYWAQKGKTELMDAYVAKCDAIKQKFPKGVA